MTGSVLRCASIVLCIVLTSTAAAQKPDERLAGLGASLRTSDAEASRKRVEEALAAYEKEGNRTYAAACHLMLGMIDMTLGRTDEARRSIDESVARYEALGDLFPSWMVLLALAEHQKQQMQYDDAIATSERLLAVLQKAALPGQRFSVDGLRPIALFFESSFMHLPPVAPEILKPILLLFAETAARDVYGSVLVEAGKLEEAEVQLGRASMSAVLFGGMFDASLQSHMGDLRRRQWRLDEARDLFQKAFEQTRLLPGFSLQGGFIEVDIIERLADIELLCGRTDEAMAWNDKAIALISASKNPVRDASILEDRGFLLFRAGRLDAADAAYEDALRTAEDAGDVHRRGAVLSKRGRLNSVRGKYGTAVSQLEQATRLLAQINRKGSEAEAWIVLSEVHLLTGALDEARTAREKAAEAAKQSRFRIMEAAVRMSAACQRLISGEGSIAQTREAMQRLWELPIAGDIGVSPRSYEQLASALGVPLSIALPRGAPGEGELPFLSSMLDLQQGLLLYQKGDNAAARAAWEKGLSGNPSADLRGGLHLLRGVAWARDGNLAEATASLAEAAKAVETTIEDMRVEEMLSTYLGGARGIHYYFELLVALLTRQERVAEAFDYAERARARAFLQTLGNGRIEPRRHSDAQLAREAESLRAQIMQWERESHAAPDPVARGIHKDLQEARMRYAALLRRVKASNSEYASLSTVQPLTIEEVQRGLPEETTLISYFVSHWNVYAWVVDRKSVRQVTLPVEPAALERVVCWSDHLGGRGVEMVAPAAKGCERADAAEAYRLLFAPLRDRIANRRLLIVPHGALHYVPFAALRDESGRYLVEDFTIQYAPSASSLRFLREKETAVSGTALVLGNPAGLHGVHLPNAVAEARRAAEALHAQPLLGADAMESRLYELGGRVDLVHLAAHGSYDAANPLFSRIALAPGEDRDGYLEVHEILSELDLSGVNLVVLATCESALGKRSGGDEVVGLTRALLYAGTPGVVSTLWRIDDEASAVLMEEFYLRLLAGDAVADALRAAQLALLRSEAFDDPRHWAAFSLYGMPQGRWSR